MMGLPLTAAQARKLIKHCQQAPYGKGDETLVNTKVRRTWEMDPDQFRLTNPKWNNLVSSIVDGMQRELGLENCNLTAHLYKLLVYEKGGFFLPHRDGEKLDRMVATLVIGLPSVHKGGELIITHEDQQMRIAFDGAASGHELSYAVFYADCQHETRPVQSGYRICLTYNVTLARSKSKKGVNAPSFGNVTESVTALLRNWSSKQDKGRLAVVLDHRYTQKGLNINSMKGIDRARAEVLFRAAQQADCIANLALVTLWRQGSAEGEDYHSHYRGHWDEEEGDDTAGDHEMGELFDESLSADHWSDSRGCRVKFGEIILDESEIVTATRLDEWEPSEEEFEGFTGNAGMTLERWYHRAAIVIWPGKRHFAMLCAAGTSASIGGLEPMVKKLGKAAKSRRDALRRDCLQFAGAIIESWKPEWNGSPKSEQNSRAIFPALLAELDAPELMRHFIGRIMLDDEQAQLDSSFAKLCKQHGWTYFETELARVLDATTENNVNRNAELLRILSVRRDKNGDRIRLCAWLCKHAVDALEKMDQTPPSRSWDYHRLDKPALLVALIQAMLAVDATKPLGRLIDHTLACDDRYDLTKDHIAALFALEPRLKRQSTTNQVISRWIREICHQLRQRTTQAPQEPVDYRRESKLSCNCSDCQALSRFLANPNQQLARFPLAKARRQHLHGIIESNRCDNTHITERQGSPFTLVCIKTTASFEAACRIYEGDLRNLTWVVALKKTLDMGTSPLT